MALAGLAITAVGAWGQAAGQPTTKNGEWPYYTADLKGSKYSPADQINASNFNKLVVAWRFRTDHLGPTPESKLEGTPLMVKGVLYVTAGTRKDVIALNAKTGEQLWMFRMDEGVRADRAPRKLSGRGVSYWTDGKGDERILYVTIGYRLIELNAKTGQIIPSFGKQGIVDLKEGVVIGKNTQIDLDKGEIGLHSTPTVVNDTVIVGASMADAEQGLFSTNNKGLVRAFDVKTGKQLWRFNTIPYPGEFGNDTWKNGSWEWTGNTGAWTQITADPELGLVYLPVESPSIDFYGGNRPGDNLYGESLVAVDLKTGARKWYFQLVHHPIWDFDISSAPLLVDATIDGKPRKLVAVPTKQSYLYVFDRITGQPIWPMPETPVPQSDVPGEKTSPTQPIPSKPAPYSRAFLGTDDIIDFTPELHQQALENLKLYRWLQTPFVPATMNDKEVKGAINMGNASGGINWPGASFDPETAIFYGQASNSSVATMGFSPDYMAIVNPEAQAAHRVPSWDSTMENKPGGGGRGGPINNGLQGLPIAKPPYGVLTAINLNTGDTLFKVAHGDTPDNIRTNPALKGLTIPKTGQPGSVGLMVTKTLVVVGDPQVTSPPGRPKGAMLRAYDKMSGAQVGEVWMPAQQSGSPMTYVVDGKQYIIIAVSNGTYPGEYIAYTLPDAN